MYIHENRRQCCVHTAYNILNERRRKKERNLMIIIIIIIKSTAIFTQHSEIDIECRWKKGKNIAPRAVFLLLLLLHHPTSFCIGWSCSRFLCLIFVLIRIIFRFDVTLAFCIYIYFQRSGKLRESSEKRHRRSMMMR